MTKNILFAYSFDIIFSMKKNSLILRLLSFLVLFFINSHELILEKDGYNPNLSESCVILEEKQSVDIDIIWEFAEIKIKEDKKDTSARQTFKVYLVCSKIFKPPIL